MSIFEKESSNFQNRNYRAHLNRNWQNGNDEFRAINERLSKINQNENNNSEIIASHVDLHGIDYKSLPFRLDNMQIIGENANQLANSINNKINTLVEDKLAQIDNSVHAYPNADSIKQAYPNGKLGIFFFFYTGHQWYWVDGSWKDGGFYQASAPIDDIRAVDAKVISNANLLKSLLADLTKEVTERKKIDADLIDKVASYLTALELKEVRLRDEQNRLLWNGNSYVTGKTYLPRTDKTGLEEGVPVDSSIIGYTFLAHASNYGLPIIKLFNPDIESLRSKADGKLKDVDMYFNQQQFHLKSIKVQGESSARYDKKNYTLNLDSAIQLIPEWGKQDKYVLKADWVDSSFMRNEYSAHLWRRIRESRVDTNRAALVDNEGNYFVRTTSTTLAGETKPFKGPNFGAIDSRYVLVYINDIFWGLYSLTVPKDGWMSDMGYGTKEAIISLASTDLKSTQAVDDKGNLKTAGVEVEYVTDEDNQKWLAQSFNEMLTVLNAVSSSDELNALDQYLDIDSAIDYYILNVLQLGEDNIRRNFLFNTWDGKKFYIAPYDMDGTFGMYWSGLKYWTADEYGFEKQAIGNQKVNAVFQKIYQFGKDKLIERWEYLQANRLNDYKFEQSLSTWMLGIPSEAIRADNLRWPNKPGTGINDVNQIKKWLSLRINFLSQEIKELKGE